MRAASLSFSLAQVKQVKRESEGKRKLWLAVLKAWRFLLQYQLSVWRASGKVDVGKKLTELSLPTFYQQKAVAASVCQ